MFLKKATVAFAALSMVATPVAASAANFDGLRVSSDIENEAALTGSSWLLAILAVAAVVGGIVIAADGSSSAPTSP
jgi:hypothetical protein